MQNYKILENVSDETKIFVNSVISYLQKNDKFNVIDAAALNMLTTNYDLYVQSRDALQTNGLVTISDRGNSAISPYYNIMKSAITSAMDILKEFGLTLKSRSKLNVLNDSDDSPLMQFLNSNK